VARFTMAGAVLSIALVSSLALPAAAQAAIPASPPGTTWGPTGNTYPDTPAGLSACVTYGNALHKALPNQNLSFSCLLNNPDPGVYNLWLLFRPAQ